LTVGADIARKKVGTLVAVSVATRRLEQPLLLKLSRYL